MTPGLDGNLKFAKKPTRFLTNSLALARMLQRTCPKDHEHQQLAGGMCANAAFYPTELVRTFVRGMSEQDQLDHMQVSEMEENEDILNGLKVDARHGGEEAPAEKPRTSKVTRTNGTSIPVIYSPCNFKTAYVDEYTGEIVKPHLIKDANLDELDYFNEHVCQIEDKANVLGIPDNIFVQSRWIMCNKGDNLAPDMRARLVACEVNKEGKNDLFHAPTPPLEANKHSSACMHLSGLGMTCLFICPS